MAGSCVWERCLFRGDSVPSASCLFPYRGSRRLTGATLINSKRIYDSSKQVHFKEPAAAAPVLWVLIQMFSKASTILCPSKTYPPAAAAAQWGFTHTSVLCCTHFSSLVMLSNGNGLHRTVVDRLALIWPTPLTASITFSHHCLRVCVSVFVCLRCLCVWWLSDRFTEWIAVLGDVVSLSLCYCDLILLTLTEWKTPTL